MPSQDQAHVKDVDLEIISMNLKEGGRCVVNCGEDLTAVDFGSDVSLVEKEQTILLEPNLEPMSMNLKEGYRYVVNRGEGLTAVDFDSDVILVEEWTITLELQVRQKEAAVLSTMACQEEEVWQGAGAAEWMEQKLSLDNESEYGGAETWRSGPRGHDRRSDRKRPRAAALVAEAARQQQEGTARRGCSGLQEPEVTSARGRSGWPFSPRRGQVDGFLLAIVAAWLILPRKVCSRGRRQPRRSDPTAASTGPVGAEAMRSVGWKATAWGLAIGRGTAATGKQRDTTTAGSLLRGRAEHRETMGSGP
ncbi:hypothetical protein BHE74_00015478 [Ensete ventricosum]|nr:hypothetical protein GW17_00043877 [Ensete ventricosum]RWW76427.1 hypothetical protein BHE74_00015478 [Ensete ventricosum]RZR96594.1 hypothetical protein BHM03_00025627 [Ensete ventricosum]